MKKIVIFLLVCFLFVSIKPAIENIEIVGEKYPDPNSVSSDYL